MHGVHGLCGAMGRMGRMKRIGHIGLEVAPCIFEWVCTLNALEGCHHPSDPTLVIQAVAAIIASWGPECTQRLGSSVTPPPVIFS